MILDQFTLLSELQAVTATSVSTHIYDTSSTADVAVGEELELFAQVIQAFNNLTSLDFIIETAADAGFSVGLVSLMSRNVLLAGLTAGSKIFVGTLPMGAKRFIRFRYVVNGTAPTTGTITAGIVGKDGLQYNIPTAGNF